MQTVKTQNKKVIKKFIYHVIYMTPITFIVMPVCRPFVLN